MKITSRSLTRNKANKSKKYKGFRKKPFFCGVKSGNQRKNHLKSKLIIDSLFLHGEIVKSPTFRLVFLEIPDPEFYGVQLLISVPKRRFKLAVARNRIRRLISEAYRLHSQEFQHQMALQKRHVAIGIIYTKNNEKPFSVIQEQLISALSQLSIKLNKENTQDEQ